MSLSPGYFHCRRCRARVARIEDYIATVQSGGIFNRVFNVEVSAAVNNHETNENIIANAYCVQCETLLGAEFIAVLRPDMYVREGRLLMNLNKLSLWNDEPLLPLNEEQNLRANEENADQDGDTTDLDEDAPDQDGDAIDQDGDTIDQDGDANEQNADLDGDANEQNADQDLGAIGQNADQYGDANEQVPNEQDLGVNEQNADQDGDANEQVPKEQDVGANEQNADQDGGGNE